MSVWWVSQSLVIQIANLIVALYIYLAYWFIVSINCCFCFCKCLVCHWKLVLILSTGFTACCCHSQVGMLFVAVVRAAHLFCCFVLWFWLVLTSLLNDCFLEQVAGKRKRDESQQPGGHNKRQIPQVPTFNHELFVAKLKYTTTSNSIQKHFTQFGEVINIGLPMKKMKNETSNKGYAFVAFKEASSLKKALAKPNQQVSGCGF